MYRIDSGASSEVIADAATSWWNYYLLAGEMEEKEYNTSVNKKWVHSKKSNPKQMWKMVDWKGQSQSKSSGEVDSTCANKYFKDIFQSEKTKGHPTVKSIQTEIDNFVTVDHPMDTEIMMKELRYSLMNVGRGIGLDGTPPEMVVVLY